MICEEACGGGHDLAGDDEIVLPERASRGRDVHNTVRHAYDGTELDVPAERHDLHLDAFGVVVALRDARILGCYLHEAHAGEVVLRAPGSPCRLGFDEAAGTETEVGEDHEVEVTFEERVVPADAAIRTAERHERRSVRRADDDVIDPRCVDDEGAAGIVQAVHGESRFGEERDGLRVERAFGDGDPDGTLGVSGSFCFEGFHEELERERESCCRCIEFEGAEQRIVAATRADRLG